MPLHTDTKFEIPDAETRARAARHNNDGATHYVARHSTDVRAPFTPEKGRHHVDDSLTRVIPPLEVKAAVPLPPRPDEAVAEQMPPYVGSDTRRIEVAQLLVRLPLTADRGMPAAAVSAPPIEPVAPISNKLLERVLRGLRNLKVRL